MANTKEDIWNKIIIKGKEECWIWIDRLDKDSFGKIIKYKAQKVGEKNAPRFPSFVGFRDERDMSE